MVVVSEAVASLIILRSWWASIRTVFENLYLYDDASIGICM
jgi:hypothetical protein